MRSVTKESAMVTISELNTRKQELEERLKDLEEKRSSLEKEIGLLVDQIPILDMARYVSLLESHTRALRGVRDMLQTMAQGKGSFASGPGAQAVPSAVPSV